MRRIVVVVLGALLAAAPRGAAEEAERPWEEQPFLGLSVRDSESGLVVGWVRPGPLGGRGTESTSGVRRGDNVVSIDGETVDAAGFEAHVAARAPGDVVTLRLRRSPDANPEASVPTGGEGGEPFELEVALGSRAAWAGLVGRGLGGRTIPDADEGVVEPWVLAAADTVGVRGPVEGHGGGLDALLAHLRAVQEEALDPNSLPAIVQCFRRPLSVDAVEAGLAAAFLAAADGAPAGIEHLVTLVLDLPPLDAFAREVLATPRADLDEGEVRSLIRLAGRQLQGYQHARGWRPRLERLVTTLKDGVYIYDDHADEHVRTLTEVGGARAEELLTLSLALLALAPAAWEAHAAGHAGGEPLAEVPEAVRAVVEGDVLAWLEDPLGHLAVVGGPGPNVYDMRRIGAVYDVGGDDRYVYGATPTDAPIALRTIIDVAGDDVHEAEAPFEGPATAVLGCSWLDDRGGDDVYRTRHPFGVGAGLMGFGVLLDRAGDDVYASTGEASGWGIGAGFYGAGLILDLDGHDVYRGERYVQGVGGPRGLGAILDRRGRDLYRANGPSFGSAYGTPAVYVGMSQGFGFGVRGYAAGGVGAIHDLAGNDRYEAGEFSQAGGYYFGLGILHDHDGHDLYYGNRYGQAFAAHQAIGILVDDAGDDTYWSMTAASQAGTWDESIGLLLDRAGDDAYRCDGLGQGAASMQALALLVDLEGDDRYSAAGGAVQGRSGANTYHYATSRVFSFSGLLDRGGGRDRYSADRENDTTVATGALDETNPERSSLHGVFSDG